MGNYSKQEEKSKANVLKQKHELTLGFSSTAVNGNPNRNNFGGLRGVSWVQWNHRVEITRTLSIMTAEK